ncbi:MAG TPA: hypothetical protein VIL74_24570 [Pyrinomonadaceae bacterium]|jgi:hypothetical protein
MKRKSQFSRIEKSYKKLLPESRPKIDYLIDVLRRELHVEPQRPQRQRKAVEATPKVE